MSDENLKEIYPGEQHTFEDGTEVTREDETGRIVIESNDEIVALSPDQIEDLAALAGRVSQPRPKMYLAYNGRAFAKALSKEAAVAKFAYFQGKENLPDPVRVCVAEGRGDLWTQQRGTMIGLRGDDIERAVEYQIPRDEFEDLVDMAEADRTEVEVDRALGEAESKDLDLDE